MELSPRETERLVIRPFTPDDVNDVYRTINCVCFSKQPLHSILNCGDPPSGLMDGPGWGMHAGGREESRPHNWDAHT